MEKQIEKQNELMVRMSEALLNLLEQHTELQNKYHELETDRDYYQARYHRELEKLDEIQSSVSFINVGKPEVTEAELPFSDTDFENTENLPF